MGVTIVTLYLLNPDPVGVQGEAVRHSFPTPRGTLVILGCQGGQSHASPYLDLNTWDLTLGASCASPNTTRPHPSVIVVKVPWTILLILNSLWKDLQRECLSWISWCVRFTTSYQKRKIKKGCESWKLKVL